HATIDIGDQYGYTKPGELAQYDLDHSRSSSVSGRHHRRHESFDHYARPNIYYNPERRGFSIETNRSHDQGKSVDTHRGPPPTTRGLDKLNRHSTMYEVPPAAPVPPPPSGVAAAVPRERRGSNRHTRPVSLYQEAPPRPSQTDDFYRPR